jgi:hypothetical protein
MTTNMAMADPYTINSTLLIPYLDADEKKESDYKVRELHI